MGNKVTESLVLKIFLAKAAKPLSK